MFLNIIHGCLWFWGTVYWTLWVPFWSKPSVIGEDSLGWLKWTIVLFMKGISSTVWKMKKTLRLGLTCTISWLSFIPFLSHISFALLFISFALSTLCVSIQRLLMTRTKRTSRPWQFRQKIFWFNQICFCDTWYMTIQFRANHEHLIIFFKH